MSTVRLYTCVGILCAALSPFAVGDCGQLVASTCPGCSTSGNPADTTCYCGDVTGGCVCRKTSGGAQSGSLTTCETNTWSYVADPNGYVMVPVEPALCMQVKWCRSSSGASCGSAPCTDTCSWVTTTEEDTTTRTPYEIGSKCVNGVPQ
jgi:hypothetical protein